MSPTPHVLHFSAYVESPEGKRDQGHLAVLINKVGLEVSTVYTDPQPMVLTGDSLFVELNTPELLEKRIQTADLWSSAGAVVIDGRLASERQRQLIKAAAALGLTAVITMRSYNDAQRVGAKFRGNPGVRASIRKNVGNVLTQLIATGEITSR